MLVRVVEEVSLLTRSVLHLRVQIRTQHEEKHRGISYQCL
jgi:hypothetical protein